MAAARPGWPARCVLSQLIDAHNRRNPEAPLSKENINVLEKARELGQHSLSGALLDPRSMDELLPGWREEAPLDAEVTDEEVYFLTEKGEFTSAPYAAAAARPWQLRYFHQPLCEVAGRKSRASRYHRLYWLCRIRAAAEGDHVTGIRTDDKGVDKQNQKKSNFEPGYDVKSKITVLAEGPRGSLTKQLIAKYDLAEGPQSTDLRYWRKRTVGSPSRAHQKRARSFTPWAGR